MTKLRRLSIDSSDDLTLESAQELIGITMESGAEIVDIIIEHGVLYALVEYPDDYVPFLSGLFPSIRDDNETI